MYEGKNTREEESTLTRRENRRRGPPPNSRSGDLGSLSRIPPRRPSRSNLLDESGHSVSSRMSNVPPSQRNSGAQRSHVRRSQSFKRTAGGSAATATSLLGPAMTAQDLLGSSDPDLLNTSDGSINTTGMIPTSTISTVGAAPAPSNMAPASITRPRLQSAASGGSNSNSGAANSKAAFSKQTSTRNFVKNFLEDYDDEYDAPIGGGAAAGVPASPSSRNKPGIQQFDAETQRNVHRSLLNPTAAGNKFNATAMAAPSASYHQTRSSGNSGNGGQPNANLFQTREDFHNIDQSVNLMDAEAGKYESKDSNKRRDQHASKMQHMQQSMVEIFLQDLSPNTMGEGGKKNKRSSIASPWYHPHRQAQWDRMTTWEKIVDVAARLLIPLFLCAMLAMVVLVIVMVYHAGTGTTHSNNDEVVSSSTPPPPVVPDEQQAMMTFLSERKLVSAQDLQDPKSPSSKALSWIAQDPIAMAGLPTSGRRLQKEKDTAEDQLVQRFVLAVLYYTWMPNSNGMGGSSLQQAASNAFAGMSLKPNNNKNEEGGPWLTAQSECQWKGISCNDDLQELRSRVTTPDRSFPTAMAGGQVVRKLNLTQHDLTGTLPSVLTALSELRELDLRGNKLTGDLRAIDWTLWSQSLEYLLLGDNQITGSIPEEWTALSRIIDIDLSNNRLAGRLPAWTDGQDPMQELENLFLDQNFLTGTIPDSMLRDMPNVNDLDLSSNTLAGTLPVIALQELHELRFLNLANNALTGALPHIMSKKLDTLTLADNQITGTIPSSLLAASKRIRHLNLSQNQLQGKVPEKLGDLTHLQELRLESNPNLQGVMPSSVCALKEQEEQGNTNLLQVTADCKTGAVTCTCCDQCF